MIRVPSPPSPGRATRLTTTGVPVPHLAYDGMTVEFEAIAMTE